MHIPSGPIPHLLFPKKFRSLGHPVSHFYAKRAAALTATASDALARMVLQGEIVLIEGSRDFRLHDSEVIELIHHMEFEEIDNGIVIDTEIQEAYYKDVLLNSMMTGGFPVPGEGNPAVRWTGGNVASVSIMPG